MVLEPYDVPSNISWSFDETDDSMLVDWEPIKYPNGNNLARLHYYYFFLNKF